MTVYSVRDAARRVRRRRSTVQRWIGEGMPYRRHGTYRVEIEEDVLLAWFRKKLMAIVEKDPRARAAIDRIMKRLETATSSSYVWYP